MVPLQALSRSNKIFIISIIIDLDEEPLTISMTAESVIDQWVVALRPKKKDRYGGCERSSFSPDIQRHKYNIVQGREIEGEGEHKPKSLCIRWLVIECAWLAMEKNRDEDELTLQSICDLDQTNRLDYSMFSTLHNSLLWIGYR